jgi:tRNA dimethylallyltransferase
MAEGEGTERNNVVPIRPDLHGSPPEGGGPPRSHIDLAERLARVEAAIEGFRHSQNLTIGATAMVGALLVGLSIYGLQRIDQTQESIAREAAADATGTRRGHECDREFDHRGARDAASDYCHTGAECAAGFATEGQIASSTLPPVLVIAGPTASGKSALALALAEVLDGVVINADSLQCYRDLRILTARPDAIAEARVPHCLYGFLDAAERGSAGRWRSLARAEIAAASGVGRLPIVVGGSGLYLRALMRGLAPIPDIPEPVRREAQALHLALGGVAFRDRLGGLDPAAAGHLAPGDTQRLLRAYEVVRATGRPIGFWQAQPHTPPPLRFRTVLLMPPRAALYAACDARLLAMLAAGALDEAAALAGRRLDPGLPAMQAAGLPQLLAYLSGTLPRDTAITAAQRATRRYAKRQMTWFRHQLDPDLALAEQFSERNVTAARHFINKWY